MLWWCAAAWGLADSETPTTRHDGIPVAHYRDAVWPVEGAPSLNVPLAFWVGHGAHPGIISHELVSDVVKYNLARLLRAGEVAGSPVSVCDAATSAPPLSVPPTASAVELTCATQTPRLWGTMLGLHNPPEFHAAPGRPGPGWEWRREAPTKPEAWVGVGGGGALTLQLRACAASPRLEVTWLRSWRGGRTRR